MRRRADMRRILVVALLFSAAANAAELAMPQDLRGSLAVYAVKAVEPDAALTLESRDLIAGTTQAGASFDSGARGQGGVRGMAWRSGQPWLAGFDLGYFDACSSSLEIRVLPVSFFLGVRAPQGLPVGEALRVQPYLLAGVSTFAAWGDAQAGALTSSFRAGRSMLAPGGDNLHAPYLAFGITVPLSQSWALEAEWRPQHWHVQSLETNSMILPTRNLLTDITLEASGFALGLAWTPGQKSRQ